MSVATWLTLDPKTVVKDVVGGCGHDTEVGEALGAKGMTLWSGRQ
jgi:hypothetical protein